LQIPVEYKVGDTTKEFQADAFSQDLLMKTLVVAMAFGDVPKDFFWVSFDNTRVPFKIDDLKGLAAAMFAQGWKAFQARRDAKDKLINEAKSSVKLTIS
jgi:hypothetical protein